MSKDTDEIKNSTIDFISYLKRRMNGRPDLQTRLNSLLSGILITDTRANYANYANDAKDVAYRKDTTIRSHNPNGVIRFLRLFSIDDGLKWFTHKWDNNPEAHSLEQLFLYLESNLAKLRNYCFGIDNQGIPAKLYYHVLNFIRPDKQGRYILYDQHKESIDTTWADLRKWCAENTGQWPARFITPSGQSFETTIENFKRTIEFRTDCSVTERFGSQLRDLIQKSTFGSVKLEFTRSYREISKDLSAYCYVNSLFDGIRELCEEWINKYKAKGDALVIDLDQNDSCYILTMLHKDSYFSCSRKKLDGLSGNFKGIREKLFSVCDFSIKSRLNGESIEIVALEDGMKAEGPSIISPTIIRNIEQPINGVLYTFKIYK